MLGFFAPWVVAVVVLVLHLIVPARAVSLQHEKQQAAAPVQVETHSAE